LHQSSAKSLTVHKLFAAANAVFTY